MITVSDSTGAGPLANGTTFTVPTYTNLINSNFGAVNELTSNINSSYNAGVAEIDKSTKLLQFDANYTWSHALDYDQNETTTTPGQRLDDPTKTAFRKGDNYGNSAFNVENRLVAQALLNSPNVETSGWLKSEDDGNLTSTPPTRRRTVCPSRASASFSLLRLWLQLGMASPAATAGSCAIRSRGLIS